MKKNIGLAVYLMFLFNNFAYSHTHDECLLIQRDTSIILSTFKTNKGLLLC